MGVGGRAARGVVGGDSGDVREGLVRRKVGGVLDEQEDAADLLQAGDGAARNDREFGGELGDGDEAEIGGAGVELACAVRRGGVVELVIGAQRGCGGFVLEVEEQRRRVEERDGRDVEEEDNDYIDSSMP